MKRILVFAICIFLLIPSAIAETDLLNMSFDELIELQIKLNKEITSRPEWKEAIIHAGIYEIGVDIPAGKWTISAKSTIVTYIYGGKLNKEGTDIDSDSTFTAGNISVENTVVNFGTSVNLDLKEGYFLYLSGDTIFTKYTTSLF